MSDVLKQIYKLRRDFVIIGLTGRTGSGCTTVAQLLSTADFSALRTNYFKKHNGEITNESRKDEIIYNFLSCNDNWQPFEIITASDILLLYGLQLDFTEFKNVIASYANEGLIKPVQDELDKLKGPFEKAKAMAVSAFEFLQGERFKIKGKEDECKKYWAFIKNDLHDFKGILKEHLKSLDRSILTNTLQNWGNNVRRYNSVIEPADFSPVEDTPACLAIMINNIAKSIRKFHEKEGKPTRIVIDALRNPFEILYFRERFAAFYTLSVNTDKHVRYEKLSTMGISSEEAKEIDEVEQAKKGFGASYMLINIDRCIELSDIFLTHNGEEPTKNRSLMNQLARYVALILHPGLVPPSPLERVMQIAHAAKLNSGCLSRQVGAAVTDESFSVKAVGWNTVAEGQTPCNLRNLNDLVSDEDTAAYSEFERNNKEFNAHARLLRAAYAKQSKYLCGLGLPYCFKDYYTTINKKHKGNQVHTRSLHAEENAFLQLGKYGSMGIKGGKLFTTASCCELCGKKAYQLVYSINHLRY